MEYVFTTQELEGGTIYDKIVFMDKNKGKNVFGVIRDDTTM